MSKNLVVYYSWMGHTGVLAEEIHKCAGGDIQRIEEAKERKQNMGAGMLSAAMGAFFGLKSRLKPMDYNLDKYDNIFLGTQVWAAKSTPAMNAYLSKANFANKNVFLFITKADDKVPQTVIDSITKRIEKKGGKVKDSFSVTTKMDAPIKPEEVGVSVKEWVGKLQL